MIAANNVSAVCRSEARIAKHHGKKIAPAKNGRRASGGETLTVLSE